MCVRKRRPQLFDVKWFAIVSYGASPFISRRFSDRLLGAEAGRSGLGDSCENPGRVQNAAVTPYLQERTCCPGLGVRCGWCCALEVESGRAANPAANAAEIVIRRIRMGVSRAGPRASRPASLSDTRSRSLLGLAFTVPPIQLKNSMIYKICPLSIWREAECQGSFSGAGSTDAMAISISLPRFSFEKPLPGISLATMGSLWSLSMSRFLGPRSNGSRRETDLSFHTSTGISR
jgi:hypothetical protein